MRDRERVFVHEREREYKKVCEREGMCVYVERDRVCVCLRERERERVCVYERVREREIQSVCVCA